MASFPPCSLLHVFPVCNRLRHAHVVHYTCVLLPNFHLGAQICIVVYPSIYFAIRCIVQIWPANMQDVQSLESSFWTASISLLISVKIASWLHWIPVFSFRHLHILSFECPVVQYQLASTCLLPLTL